MPYDPPEKIADALTRNRIDIIEAIGNTVEQSFRLAIRTNEGWPDEVQMFSSFFFRGLPKLERRLNAILQPDGVSVTICGIFCHQTPQVKFDHPPGLAVQCELSDLTFFSTYGGRLPDGQIGNALMTQAKINRADILHQKVQRALYENVTNFQYVAQRLYGSSGRILPPKDSPALWYWDFQCARPNATPYSQWAGATNLILPNGFGTPFESNIPFERGLFDLMIGISGRGFKHPANGECKWNQIVWDLLRVTCLKAVGQKNVYARQANRLRGRDAIKVVSSIVGIACFAVKNSFGRIFKEFDEELSTLGSRLEHPRELFTLEELEAIAEKFDAEGAPPKERIAYQEDPGAEGGSFVIINFNYVPKFSIRDLTASIRKYIDRIGSQIP